MRLSLSTNEFFWWEHFCFLVTQSSNKAWAFSKSNFFSNLSNLLKVVFFTEGNRVFCLVCLNPVLTKVLTSLSCLYFPPLSDSLDRMFNFSFSLLNYFWKWIWNSFSLSANFEFFRIEKRSKLLESASSSALVNWWLLSSWAFFFELVNQLGRLLDKIYDELTYLNLIFGEFFHPELQREF